MKLLTLSFALWVSAPAFAGEAPPQRHCVWPAVGGALAGASVGGWGFLLATGFGSTAFANSTGGIALVAGLELAGMIGGSMLACRLWGHEGRWFPTAAFLIVGGALGGAALAAAAFLLIQQLGIDANTDNPMASALLILSAIVGGIALGSYGAYRLDLALRGPLGQIEMTVLPMVGPGMAGLMLGAKF